MAAVPKISIGSSSQDSISGPASTSTKSIKFKTKESAIASVQGDSASAVRVSITFPLLKSRPPGVYDGSSVMGLLKVPSPEVVHCKEE